MRDDPPVQTHYAGMPEPKQLSDEACEHIRTTLANPQGYLRRLEAALITRGHRRSAHPFLDHVSSAIYHIDRLSAACLWAGSIAGFCLEGGTGSLHDPATKDANWLRGDGEGI